MRYYFNSFFRIFFVTIAVFVLHKSVYRLASGETLIVRTSSGVVKETITKEGFHFIPEKLVPGLVTTSTLRIKNRSVTVPIRKELSGGLFPEMGDEGYLILNYTASYSISPESLDEIFSEANGKEESISKIASEFVQQKFSISFSALYKDPTELPLLKNRIIDYTEKNILTDLNDPKSKFKGFTFENVRISKLDLPDPKVYLRLFAGTDLVIRARIERANASIRGEGIAIEQTKKDEAYFKRLEKTAGFLKKYPDLKEFALTDRLSEKVQVIALPNEKYIGEALKDKIKPKRIPKEIE